MVREAVRNAVPVQRKKTERPALKMASAVSLVELRIKEAYLPTIKTLEEFDFTQSPHISTAHIRAEPALLIGNLATSLAIAACRQRKRVRFTTAAALVNQLIEAQREQSLSSMLVSRASESDR